MTQERRMTMRATSGTVTVVATLYGDVDEAREARERAILTYRASQLDYVRPKPREPRYVPPEQEEETW